MEREGRRVGDMKRGRERWGKEKEGEGEKGEEREKDKRIERGRDRGRGMQINRETRCRKGQLTKEKEEVTERKVLKEVKKKQQRRNNVWHGTGEKFC